MSNKYIASLEGVVKSDSCVEQGEALRGKHRLQGRLFGILCSRGGLLGESTTLTSLGNDRGFISKRIYHTNVKIRDP